jgi:hypothetical protein
MARRAPMDRLLILWATIGSIGVATAIYCNYKCADLNPAERSFRDLDPEEQAQRDEDHRWVARLDVLANGSLVYGFLGVLVFYRRGCVVFVIAAGVVVICEFALMDATWVPL